MQIGISALPYRSFQCVKSKLALVMPSTVQKKGICCITFDNANKSTFLKTDMMTIILTDVCLVQISSSKWKWTVTVFRQLHWLPVVQIKLYMECRTSMRCLSCTGQQDHSVLRTCYSYRDLYLAI